MWLKIWILKKHNLIISVIINELAKAKRESF